MSCSMGSFRKEKDLKKLDRVVYENKKPGNVIFQIISKPSRKNYSFDKEGKDRVYYLRTTKDEVSTEWAIEFEEQLLLLDLIISNKIIDRQFYIYLEKVRKRIDEIKLKRLK